MFLLVSYLNLQSKKGFFNVRNSKKFFYKNILVSYAEKPDQYHKNRKIVKKPEKMITIKEEVYYEGSPSLGELIIPILSTLTLIGLVSLFSAMLRQKWVRYKITDRRISVNSSFLGSKKVQIVYRDIEKIKFIPRFWGTAADIVIFMKDGTSLEMRSLENWKENILYILSKCTFNAYIE